MWRTSSWVAMWSCFAAAAHADDLHVLPCRPTLACTADLSPPGTLELELGYQLRRVDDGAIDQHTVPVLVKLPLATWLEAQLGETGYAITPTARYLDNITLGAKLHVLDQRARVPSIAFTLTASVPTASQQGYLRAYDLFATAHASKDIGALHADLTVGVFAWRIDGPVAYQAFTAFAATYAITSRWSATVEPHYLSDAAPLAARDIGAIAGIAYAARPWLVIDGAVDVVFAAQSSTAALIGVSLAPVPLWGAR